MSTKLKSIYIDGFKNIVDSTVPVHGLTTIVGPNNSGKSNFLEIFSFLLEIFFGSDESRNAIFKEGKTKRGASVACHLDACRYKPVEVRLEAEMTGYEDKEWIIDYTLKIQCKDMHIDSDASDQLETGFVYEELKVKEKSKSGRSKTLFKRNGKVLEVRKPDGKFYEKNISNNISSYKAIKILYPEYDKLDIDLRIAFGPVINACLTSVFLVSPHEIRKQIGSGAEDISTELEINSFDILSELYKIKSNEELFSEFENALCSILGLEEIQFNTIGHPTEDGEGDGQKYHFFRLKLPGQPYAGVREFSDGTLMVIALLLGLLAPERQEYLMCIEEPENCLHPKALKTLINYLKQKKEETQVVITTHSQTIVNMVDPRDIVVADVNNGNGTTFREIENLDALNKRLRNSNFDFGSLLETDFKMNEAESF